MSVFGEDQAWFGLALALLGLNALAAGGAAAIFWLVLIVLLLLFGIILGCAGVHSVRTETGD